MAERRMIAKRRRGADPRAKLHPYETNVYRDVQADAVVPLYRVLTHCRMCGSAKLTEYLDLGFTPPADQFRKKEERNVPEIFYPLRVLLCAACGLSQLSIVVDPAVLYQYDYPYEQSTTRTGQNHWDAFADMVVARLGLKAGDLVVDVGSNVGVLLGSFKRLGMAVCGIDPAPNIVAIANKEHNIPTICDFFNKRSAAAILKKSGKASVVVGTNVFAHIDDLDEVMAAAKTLLKSDGVFIFESPYFGHLVDSLEYDTIYHEHLSYLSAAPLIPFFKKFGMEIFMIKETDIHGGSFRVFACSKGKWPVDKSVGEFVALEKKRRLHDIKGMRMFAKRVAKNREDLLRLVEDLLRDGKRIAAVSAPAKGMTLLNYTGLTNRHVEFISEKARLKIGRLAPGGHAGGHIRVVSDEALLAARPDYALLLAWNFSKEIVQNLKAYTDKGGKFIVPIPEPHIL